MTQGQTEEGSFEQRERRRTVCREPAVRVLPYRLKRCRNRDEHERG